MLLAVPVAPEHDAPPDKQFPVHFAEFRARLDGESFPSGIVRNARHLQKVDDHADRRIRNKRFQAVSTASYNEPQSMANGALHSLYYSFGGIRDAEVVGSAFGALVEVATNLIGVSRIAWLELFRRCASELAFDRHSAAWSDRTMGVNRYQGPLLKCQKVFDQIRASSLSRTACHRLTARTSRAHRRPSVADTRSSARDDAPSGSSYRVA